ncbi:MFS transporter [Nonomuraea sp. NPDC050790]|uniref:MFS transporter n=1 Tax=Nonomuraea sp. NPDC050790 TaxID=3364371 RepID=UPI0037BDA103
MTAEKTEVPQARLTRTVALTTMAMLGVSYILNAMDRQLFPVLLPDIRADLGLALSQGGLLATVFTLGIGLAGVPTGILLDRLSRKGVMAVGILIYSGFTLLTAYAVGFFDMFAYRALSGVGEAMQITALFAAVGAYFHASRALALGYLNTVFGLGSVVGPFLGAKLATATGDWATPFVVYGLLGLVMIVVLWLGVPKVFSEQAEPARSHAVTGQDHLPASLLNRDTVLLAVSAGVVGVMLYSYLGIYPTYLQEELGFSKNDAGFAAAMFGFGATLSIVGGYLGDRLDQRRLMLFCLAGLSVVGLVMFHVPGGYGTQYALSFAEGALASGVLFVNLYSAIQRSVRPELAGRVSGLFVACFYIPSAFAGYLFTALKGQFGWGGAAVGVLGILPVVAFTALLLAGKKRGSHR